MIELLALFLAWVADGTSAHFPREPMRYDWRHVFAEFRGQTGIGDFDAMFYEDLFSIYPVWNLRKICPALIESYTEPGAIQRGFRDDSDEEAVQRYMAMPGNPPPIFVVPVGPGHEPYRWLHRDGQTRARAAYLLGIDVLAYVPVDRSDR